jgi:hypothetical protein
MRVLVRNGALTHIFSPRTFYPRFVHSLSPNPFTFRMASNSSDWTAPRVRETFLDYFKKNGHTFGELRLSLSFFETPPKISPAMKLTLVFT